ncbi:MAG: GAF domain-containing protein [Elusimicrobiota bacterium]
MKKKISQSDPLDELKIFSDLSTLFSSTLELQHTLDETISLVNKLSKADACFLYLLDLTTNDLVLSASKTPHPQEIGHLRLKIGEGITGWVAKHHKTLALSKDAHKDPRFKGALPEDIYQAFLSIPILIKNTLVGVINVQHKKPHTYSPRLINILTMIGKQIGGAIETARLYDETRKRAKALEALTAVSHTLTLDRYPEEIMQLIVNMTAQMMGTNICSIMLLDDKGQELRIVASQSLDPEYQNKPPVKVHGSLSGKAVLTKQYVTAKDVRNESSYQFRDLAIRQGLVALLSVPMMYKGKVLGVLNSYLPVEHHYTKDEISFAQSVANQCASAIENTRLLSEKLAAQEALEARKVIERAKGILMETKKIGEPQAFREIQRQSMDRRKSMKEISEAIILAHDMVK